MNKNEKRKDEKLKKKNNRDKYESSQVGQEM